MVISKKLTPASSLKGEIVVPGDKSISHRGIIFASLAHGRSTLSNLLLGEDVLATMRIFRQLGVSMSHEPEELKPGDCLTIDGKGGKSFIQPRGVLDCGNSGTTMRLMLGLAATLPFECVFTGDESLNKRPMERVLKPLEAMGAKYKIWHDGNKRFISIIGSQQLKGQNHHLSVASAQLKSALILAALAADAPTKIVEPGVSRNHTELLLKSLGAPITIQGNEITIQPTYHLKPFNLLVQGDFSSAAFFMVAGLIVPHSELRIISVGVNPTRSALADVLIKMGGNLAVENKKTLSSGELVADILVRSSSLKGTLLKGEIIPKLIDEIPIFSIAAAKAKGRSTVSDAAELRIKESDRIASMGKELATLGVSFQSKPDGFVMEGGNPFRAGRFKSHGDHRIAMSLSIAALNAEGPSQIEDIDCVATSFPGFYELLDLIRLN